MNETLRRLFAEYAAFHTTRGNRACHALGIPIIVLASLSRLARVPLVAAFGVTLTLAEALIALFVAYYLTLDRTLAAMMHRPPLTAAAALPATSPGSCGSGAAPR